MSGPGDHPSLFGEQEEAQRALHGLDGLEAAAPARRVYTGPRDPDALLAHFGVESFRPGQREAVAAALEGRDSLVVMPTGGGKSLCYQLPGLAGEELTIVVSPLIALMADQVKRLAAGGHPAVMLASGMRAEESRAALEAVGDGRARIVYCSPERFGSVSFLETVGRREVDLFAIDEAHCVSEWGHDFRPDYLRLPRAIERLGRPAVMACTATATPQVSEEIERRLGMRDPLRVRSGFDRPNLSFDIVPFEGKGSKLRKLGLLSHALKDQANRPAIVYCGTRRETEEVSDALRERDLSPSPTTRGCSPTSAPRPSTASWRATPTWSWPPTPSVWAWTRRTCAPSGTGRSRPASRPTTRRPGARAATGFRPGRCCSRCAPTSAASCASSRCATSSRPRSKRRSPRCGEPPAMETSS